MAISLTKIFQRVALRDMAAAFWAPPAAAPLLGFTLFTLGLLGSPGAGFAQSVAQELETKREQAQMEALTMTPIAFYGKAVDENNKPIAEAKVRMTAADHPYAVGSEYERKSDAAGSFSITGIHGIGLLVRVSKDGYYTIPESWGNFAYAIPGGGENPPHANPNNPAIFVLRQMGATEKLIVQSKDVKISKTGTPVFMNLRTGETGSLTNSDLEIQTWIQEANGSHYDWNCLITVPGGGIQQRTEGESNFIAFGSGYPPAAEIKMAASDPAWDSRVTREYFLQLADGAYARMILTIHAGGDNFFSIVSYLNPTPGHRNLEYNPKQ